MNQNKPVLISPAPTIIETERMFGRRSFTGWDSAYFEYTLGKSTYRIIFVTLTSMGLKLEGQPLKGYYTSRGVAENALNLSISDWITGHPGHIHWRQPITITELPFFELGWITGPAGLKPVLEPRPLWCASCRLAVDEFTP